ncbi:MAG: tetratricopeptide repeat protein [Chitinophagaceae bacterium]|nr:tetratricopeptide repeat protein [Chitinophagaceae bacterium]MBN8667382.1 tetratricopeptide repeat protein [Chitinophagales bacterium]
MPVRSIITRIGGLIILIPAFQSVFAQADTVALGQALERSNRWLQEIKHDSAYREASQVAQVANKKGYRRYEALAYDIMAEVMRVKGKMEELRRYDSLLTNLAGQLKDTSLIISARNRMGVYLLEQGRTNEAADFFLTSLDLKLEKEQSIKTAEVYSNLGSVYMALSKKDQAMEWFVKSLKLYEKLGNDRGLGETYSNISSLYYLMSRIDDAIAYQKQSIFHRSRQNDIQGLIIPNINIGQLYILKDSSELALRHLRQAVEYAEKVKLPPLRAAAYSGMSTFYIKSRQFGPALEWQDKAIALFEETDNKPMLSRMYVSAGNLASAMGDSASAIRYYGRGLDFSLVLGNKENIANVYEKMSNFYLARQDHLKAYQHYKSYTLYRDSIALASSLSNIERIKIQYETEKKDNEIQRLAADQRIQQLQIEKQNALIAGNLLEASRKQNEIELLSQSRELQELRINQQDEQLEKQILLAKTKEQQLQLAETEKQLQNRKLKESETLRNFILVGVGLLALLGYFLFNRYQLKRKIQQQEALLAVRENIAKDLHDEIGSTLTSIKILSEVSERNIHTDQAKTSSFIKKITEQSAAAQQGISDIVWAVKPENDKLENMVIRMREYVAQTLESRNIQTLIEIDEEVLHQRLSMSQRRDFFLIFKEAINNIAKYAEANLVTIHLRGREQGLGMRISDNGKGFDLQAARSSNGLKNMHTRAESLHGRVEIKSQSGQGTVVDLYIPTT